MKCSLAGSSDRPTATASSDSVGRPRPLGLATSIRGGARVDDYTAEDFRRFSSDGGGGGSSGPLVRRAMRQRGLAWLRDAARLPRH